MHILAYVLHISNMFSFNKARRNKVSDMKFLKIKKDISGHTCIKRDFAIIELGFLDSSYK